jgi:hypothetical protein
MSPATALSEAKRNLLRSYLSAPATQPRVVSPQILATSSGQPAPLTISQEQLVLRETRRPDAPPLYNECIQLRMPGPLNVHALEKSFAEIVRRHEIWRTAYAIGDNQALQVIHPATDQIEIPLLDFQGFPKARREEEIDRVIGSLVQQPFSLKNESLLRTRLIRVNDTEHRLYVIAHLSIVDGLSVYQIFPNELAALYRAHVSGRSSDLEFLSIQFADYSRWQRQTSESENFTEQLEYWRVQLAGEVPPLSWPADRPRPSQETFRGEIEKFVMPAALAHGIKTLARREGATLFVAILSLLAALLHSYTRQDDFAIGTPSPSGRKRSEVQQLLGYFLTPVALRFHITRNMTFCELLRQAQRLTLEAISNDDPPVEVLTQRLGLHVDPSRNPLFTVATSLQPAMPKLDLDWTVTSMDINSGGAPWDLYLAFIDGREGMLGRLQYNPDLFETETIAHFVQDYQDLALIVSLNPDKRLCELCSNHQ